MKPIDGIDAYMYCGARLHVYPPPPLMIRESSRPPSLWCVPPRVTGRDPLSARHGDVRPPVPARGDRPTVFVDARPRPARDGDGGAGDGDGGAETMGDGVERVVVERVVTEGARVDDDGTLDAREGRWDEDEDRRRRREDDEEDATREEESRRVVLDDEDEEEEDDDDGSSDI